MQSAEGSFRLIVRRGPQPNQIHELNKDIITVGRDITNDITINDPEVSRHHARITRGGGGYTIEDLGSTNGTFVNSQRLTGARQLSPGDMIGLGETVTLAYESTAMAAQSAAGPGAVLSGMPRPAESAPPPAAPVGFGQSRPPASFAPPAATPGQYQQPPAVSPTPSPPQPAYQAPPPYQQPGDYPQPAYQQPGDIYGGGGGSWSRWLLLGCGCFIVLCVIGAVVAVIVIDSTCAWQNPPLKDIIEAVGLTVKTSAESCQ